LFCWTKKNTFSNHYINSVEKEQQDNAQKQKDSQEAGQKVLELQRKLDHAREVVRVSQKSLIVFCSGCFNVFKE
jgi:hypothetical protein